MPYADPEIARAKAKERYYKNHTGTLAVKAAYYIANREKVKSRCLKLTAAWRSRNKEHISKQQAEYHAANRHWINQSTKARKKKVKLHKPHWIDFKDITKIYVECPSDRVVDHIIAIRGKVNGAHVVCGFHAPVNMQYLSQFDNDSKGSKVDLESEENRLMSIWASITKT